MTTLRQINQLLVSELNYLYQFEISPVLFNSLENEENTYESFWIELVDGEKFYFQHLAGKLFNVTNGIYSPEKLLTVTPDCFEALRQFSIKSLLKKQINTFDGLIRDTQERINELAESLAYYNKERNKSVQLLDKLEGEN